MKARSGHENAKKPAPEQFLVWQLGSRSCYSQQWQGPTARIDPVTAIVFNSRANKWRKLVLTPDQPSQTLCPQN